MAGLFGGLAKQAAALLPIQPQAPVAAPRRGLIGGGRQGPDLNSILTFLSQGTNGLDRNRTNATAQQAAQIAEQQRQQRAEYAATIQDPIERQVFMTAPGEWASNAAKRFAPETLAAGSVQVLNGQPVAGAPRVERFDDRFGAFDPVTGESSFSAPRGPTYAEETQRNDPVNLAPGGRAINPITGATIASAPDTFSLGPQDQRFEGGRMVAANNTPRPMSDADQKAVADAEAGLARIDNTVTRAEQIAAQIDNGELNLGPVTNLISGARNAIGRSDANSLNFDSLRNWALEARNQILSEATGVQTDGDAVRALDLIISGTNDERIVRQAIDRFTDARRNTRQVLERDIARRSGAQSPGQPQTQQQAQGPIAVNPTTGARVQWNGQAWVPL